MVALKAQNQRTPDVSAPIGAIGSVRGLEMYSIHDVKDDSGKLLRSYILCTIFDFSGGQTASNAFGEDSEVSSLENSFSTLYADQKIEEIALVGCDVDCGRSAAELACNASSKAGSKHIRLVEM